MSIFTFVFCSPLMLPSGSSDLFHPAILSFQPLKSGADVHAVPPQILSFLRLAGVSRSVCPPEKPQRGLILGGRSGGSRPRLCVSPRVLRHKVSLRRAALQKAVPFTVVPVMVPMSCLPFIFVVVARVGD